MNAARRTLWDRSTLMGLALPTLVVTLGLQILRVFFPSLAWYLRDTVGVGSATLGGIAFAAFLPGYLAPLIYRWLGSRNSLWLAAGGVAALRLAEQIVIVPQVDLWLSFAGTTCFVLFFSFFIAHTRSQGHPAAHRWAGGLLLGLVLDSSIKGVSGTLDVSWIAGLGPILLIAVLALMVGWLLWKEPPSTAGAPTDGSWGQAVPFLAVGPVLLLEAMILQNQGWVAQVAGLSAPLAFVMVLLGNLVAQAGLLAAYACPQWVRPLPALVAGLVVFASTFVVGDAGSTFPYVLLLTQFLLGWALGMISGAVASADRPGIGRSAAMLTTGLVLYLLLAFVYYVSYDLPLPIPRPAVLPDRRRRWRPSP